MHTPFGPPVTRALAALAVAVLLVPAAACTSSEEPAAETPAPPGASTGVAPTIEPKPVPMDVAVAQVVGNRLRKGQVRRVERQVGRTVGEYFDAAFLGGEYPRRSFPDAFASFSTGAARLARGDRRHLTNLRLAPSTEQVVPRRKRVRLSVLVPNRIVAGVTARVRLVYVAVRPDAADQEVTVTGRLLLARARKVGWEIFGYDVARSAVPVDGGGRRSTGNRKPDQQQNAGQGAAADEEGGR